MRIAVQSLNNEGVKVVKSKLTDSILNFTKQYYNACNELYNLGYSPSPSCCEKEEVYKVLISDEPALCSKFSNALSGEFSPTLLRLQFVLQDTTLSDECKEVLKLLYLALEAEQALEDLGLLCESVKFAKKSDITAAKTRLTVSRSIYNTTKVPLDSPYVQKLFYLDKHKVLLECDYVHILIENALGKLGVSPLVVASAFENNTSLLLGDSYTFKDDCKFFSLLISGQIIGKGQYGKLLFDSIEKYYQEYYATRTTKTDCILYEEQNFLDATPQCIEYLNVFRRNLTGTYSVHYVTSEKVIFVVDGELEDKPIVSRDYFIGSYVYDYENKCPIDAVNLLRGLSGEYVLASSLERLGLECKCMPIQMWSYYVGNSGSTELQLDDYVPLCCCRYIEDTAEAPLPDFVYNKKFEWLDVKETCKKLGVSSLESVAREIADAIDIEYNGHTNEFRLFVGHLVQALICVRCDYTLKWHKSPNHVLLNNDMYWLDRDGFELAMYEAKNIFEKLGF